jgi:hypothetical protein
MFKRIWAINHNVDLTCRFMPARVALCGSNPRSNDRQTIKALIIFPMIRPLTCGFLSGWRDLNPRPLRPEPVSTLSSGVVGRNRSAATSAAVPGGACRRRRLALRLFPPCSLGRGRDVAGERRSTRRGGRSADVVDDDRGLGVVYLVEDAVGADAQVAELRVAERAAGGRSRFVGESRDGVGDDNGAASVLGS